MITLKRSLIAPTQPSFTHQHNRAQQRAQIDQEYSKQARCEDVKNSGFAEPSMSIAIEGPLQKLSTGQVHKSHAFYRRWRAASRPASYMSRFCALEGQHLKLYNLGGQKTIVGSGRKMSMHVSKKLGGSIPLKGCKVEAVGKRGEFSIMFDDKRMIFKARDDETASKWIDAINYCVRGKSGRASLRTVAMPRPSKRGSTLSNAVISEDSELEHLTHLKTRAETGDYWERRASTAGRESGTRKFSVAVHDDKEFRDIHMAPPSSLVSDGPPLPPPPLLEGKPGRASLRTVAMPRPSKRGSTLSNAVMSEDSELEHLTHLKTRAETGDYWERRASTAGRESGTRKFSVAVHDDKEFRDIHMAPPSSLVSDGPPLPPPPLLEGKPGRASLRTVAMPRPSKRGSTLSNAVMSEDSELEHLTHLKTRAETGDYWERRASTAGRESGTRKFSVAVHDDKEFRDIHMAPPSSLVSDGPPLPPPPPLDHSYTEAKLELSISALAAKITEQAVKSALIAVDGGR